MSGRDLSERQLTEATGMALWPATVTGELVAIAEEGRVPLVLYAGQPGTPAVQALRDT